MKFHDLDRLVRESTPAHRLYNAAEVEAMRVNAADAGMALSRFRAKEVNLSARVDDLRAMADEFRAEKRYDLADRLRKFISAFDNPYGASQG